MRTRTTAAMLTFASVLAVTAGLMAQSGAAPATYLTPPQAMIEILDAEPLPSVTVGPQREMIALMARRSMPSIEDVSQPMLRIAGLRINPKTNGPHSTSGGGTAITLRGITTGAERKVDVPANAKLGGLSFSPNGDYLAFENTTPTRIDLHIADTATGQSRKVDAALNGLSGCTWLEDSSGLICGFVPDGRGNPPVEPVAPVGPNVQENYGRPGPVRTYQDLLSSAHDEALFEYYYTSQPAIVDAKTASRTTVGAPGLYSDMEPSPNGEFILVERVKRPFSRLLTVGGFPSEIELWTRGGQKVRMLADVPMGDTVPIRGVMQGPRSHEWAPLQPAALVWVEALDKGDLQNDVPHRDRVMTLAAPFTAQPREVAKTEYRYSGVNWSDDGTILLSESDRATRTTRLWRYDANWGEPRQLWDRKQQDAYGNPGSPIVRPGKGTVLQSGDWIYLTGRGSSPEGDRPFLDRLHLKTLAKERLWRSDATSFESVVGLLADDASKILTERETKVEPPNYYVRDLKAGSQQAITQFKDPHPQITAAERMLVTYKRKDGVQLNGTIYLPPGYRKGTRVPMVLWAYPREFVDADAASQVTGSPNTFTSIRGASHLLMLTQGYAIFDGATMPIIGPGETANDTYIEQLVASAQAAADKAVELGIADRHRIGVGGHSYGAFMTANLLAHSDIFAAGVARSGAYNRTLTPFGFQAETRTFWEVPHIYSAMSPFFHAHKINEPILLIHGEADNNSGTFPIQSERLYMALKGHGATVRYVTLPNESHGYAARESILHTLAETYNWFEKYVKNAKPRGTDTNTASK
jgi:dipeptidyl aminopeptidase/acylaminoacyl peptidase